jgi:hypothetical protein
LRDCYDRQDAGEEAGDYAAAAKAIADIAAADALIAQHGFDEYDRQQMAETAYFRMTNLPPMSAC